MSKELPKVYANKIEKNIENNKEYVVSKNEEKKETNNISENTSIEKNINQKINEIFSSYKYVYKADVVITTDEGEIVKNIIGKNGNNLITMDNELIDINSIKDIKFKE